MFRRRIVDWVEGIVDVPRPILWARPLVELSSVLRRIAVVFGTEA